MRFLTGALAAGLLTVPAMFGQSVISAHSGVVHYVEGKVLLNNEIIDPKFGHFPDVKQNQELRTEEGKAEILLTPGVFIRLGENSGIRMISNQLADTRVEITAGSALVECAEILKDNSITILYKDSSIGIAKSGLYRIDADSAAPRLRVYTGEALLTSGSDSRTVKAGHEASFGAVIATNKFDVKDTDELYRWSSRRDSYISVANVSSARSARNMGGGSGFTGGSSWAWNQWYGMFTYVPYDRVYSSPFGWNYFSPGQVGYLYNYYSPYYGYGQGYNSNPISIRTSPVSTSFSRSADGLRASSTSGGFGTGTSNSGGFSNGGSRGVSNAGFGGGSTGGGSLSGGAGGRSGGHK